MIRALLSGVITVTVGGNKPKLTAFRVKETNFMTFGAKGSSSALIYFTPLTTTLSDNQPRYVVVIRGGGESISRVAARKDDDHVIESSAQRNGPGLKADEFSQFWLSWSDLEMAVGCGSEVGNGTMVSLPRSFLSLELNHLYLASQGSTEVTYKYYNGNA